MIDTTSLPLRLRRNLRQATLGKLRRQPLLIFGMVALMAIAIPARALSVLLLPTTAQFGDTLSVVIEKSSTTNSTHTDKFRKKPYQPLPNTTGNVRS